MASCKSWMVASSKRNAGASASPVAPASELRIMSWALSIAYKPRDLTVDKCPRQKQATPSTSVHLLSSLIDRRKQVGCRRGPDPRADGPSFRDWGRINWVRWRDDGAVAQRCGGM